MYIYTRSATLFVKSNGMVERAIKTVKSFFIKTKRSNGVVNLAIVEYNNNPKENL